MNAFFDQPVLVHAAAIGLLVAGAGATTLLRRSAAVGWRLHLVVSLVACALAAAASVRVLSGDDGDGVDLRAPWAVPGGGLHLRLDALAAWYSLAVAAIGAPVALYAPSYLQHAFGEAPANSPGAEGGRTRHASFAAAFQLCVAAMLLLAVAHDGVLFLAAWEGITLCAWFLVVLLHESERVRAAGRLYLIANHLGSLCLLAFVAVLAARATTLDFDDLAHAAHRGTDAAPAAWLLLPMLAGFGVKAGIVPLHIWLPHAHPVATSPVSALLSGIVIKAGVFGMLRFLPLLPPLPEHGGVPFLALGAAGGVLGVLYALGQHELKRLLAYHSIENVGIILLGVGVGIGAARTGHPAAATLGFTGALLHLLNHALFKTLLFLGAGDTIAATGSGEIDRLGGLLRRLPWTGAMFLVACVAICGLPPANGFVSEWSIHRALFAHAAFGPLGLGLAAGAAILTLALIAGLAAACFAKAFGAVFLGQPRSHAARPTGTDAPSPSPPRLVAMAALALACLGIGLFPHLAVRLVWPAAAQLAVGVGRGRIVAVPAPDDAAAWFRAVAAVAALVLLVAGALTLLRLRLARSQAVAAAPTWGCGFARPSARMQHTGSSFAAPLLRTFGAVLRPHLRAHRPEGPFANAPAVETSVPDAAEAWVFRPIWRGLHRTAHPMRLVQQLPVQAHVLLVAVTLAVLLVWGQA